MTAFRFTRRIKDYGGIFLGIGKSAKQALLELMNELEREQLGHSRKIPLKPVNPNFVWMIRPDFPDAYQPLASLRIGTSINKETHVIIAGDAGIIWLSSVGIETFREQIKLVTEGTIDMGFSGDSGEPGDRLRLWPL